MNKLCIQVDGAYSSDQARIGDLPLATTTAANPGVPRANLDLCVRAFRVPPIHLGGFIARTTTPPQVVVVKRGE